MVCGYHIAYYKRDVTFSVIILGWLQLTQLPARGVQQPTRHTGTICTLEVD